MESDAKEGLAGRTGSGTRWEYAVLTVMNGVNEKMMDRMGREEWEMCGCHVTRENEVTAYFKRPIHKSPNAPASATGQEGKQ